MMRLSIRVRLTAWYLGVVSLAALALGVGSYWLLARGITRATDERLRSRIDAVGQFIGEAEATPLQDSLVDELREYADLTHGGEVLIDVRDPAGTPLLRPTIPGWDAMADSVPTSSLDAIHTVDVILRGAPFRMAAARYDARGRSFRVSVAEPMGPMYGALRRVRVQFAALFPVFVLLAAVGGYWLTGRALSPVRGMTRAVRTMTVQSLDQRIDVPAPDDELRELASTFNEMLARLGASVADIVRFTADASHELRTPVSRVRTTAELALRRERTPDEYRAALASVLDETERMTRLVDELLVLARADAGVERSESTAFDVVEVAEGVERAMQALATSRRVTLRLESGNGPIELQGDSAALRRLLVILLENAIAYTPPGGQVLLRASDGRPRANGAPAATIEVQDTGAGIDPQDLPHVFERFFRGAAARQRAPEGAGLGLAIARTIVDRWGGTIRIENAEPSGGCRVHVELPGSSPS